MSTQQPSFAIKSSHRFVNPTVEETLIIDSSKEDDPDLTISVKQTKGATKTESYRKESSDTGMVIRTTNTSLEDYY